MSIKTEKYISYAMLAVLIAALIPVVYLGRYSHPTGDDYYYGATTRLAWEETGRLGAVLLEALKGVAVEYMQWQGSYSAMLLMYLPPNLFGDWAYRLVPAVMILLLVGSIFYLLKPILCGWLKGSKYFWITVSSLLALLCVQTVPSQGETFFWYNGSMYYTAYFAGTLFLIGMLLRWLHSGGKCRIAGMIFLALFLAGGNYVSLLLGLLLLATITALLAYRKERKAWGSAAVFLAMLAGLIVSASAPGNQIRQSGMWQIPAWKAVLKSLLQGVRYMEAWIGLWWVLTAVVITPFLWKYMKQLEYKFSLPVLVVGYAYGIFCSMSCPTFYTMNSTGPARVVAIVYYGFVLFTFFGYGYLLGYLQKRMEAKKDLKWLKKLPVICVAALLAIQIFNGAYKETTTGKAVGLLLSGEAAAYEAEYQERVKILEDDSVKDVVFQPYEHQPEMLYVGDISGDVDEPTNKKVAQYYHKNSVRVAH